MRYVLGLLLLTACGGSDTTGPSEMQINGNWEFGGSMSAGQVSCTGQGTFTITQSGAQFSGSGQQVGSCSSPGGVYDNSGAVALSGGEISGNHLSFQGGVCNYQGTVSGSPANHIEGTNSCTIAVSGQAVTFNGTWQAGR